MIRQTTGGTGVDWRPTVQSLSGLIEQNADTCEALGEVTPTLIGAFADSGLYSLFLPKEFGGAELSLVDLIEIVEEISRADGSVGWATMVMA